VRDVRRGADRAESRAAGIITRHSFSSGSHYDPANTQFGLLVAHDEHVLQAGSGFEMHPHRDVEIVTWVLRGTLLHEDSTGHRSTVRHGTVQHLAAGSGVEHAERNGGADELCFVQMLLLGDGQAAPTYTVTSSTILRLEQANLHVVRLDGDVAILPRAPYVHLYVAQGEVELADTGTLRAGDAARLSGSDGHAVSGDAELLIWEMLDAPAR
jgi:redox-sensitive bicupin YhaK (pirin superfamily)